MSRQTDIKHIPVVALVLEDHQGNILIQQRKNNVHLGGLWEFPGGKIEANESHKQALIREIQEELNYTPQNPKHLVTVSHQYPGKAIELIVFYEQSSNPAVSAAENQPLKWIPKAQLSNFPMPEADLPIISLINSQS